MGAGLIGDAITMNREMWHKIGLLQKALESSFMDDVFPGHRHTIRTLLAELMVLIMDEQSEGSDNNDQETDSALAPKTE